MKRPTSRSRRQFALCLEPEIAPQPLEETREALITALADLLLEALSEEMDEQTSEQGGRYELENNS